MLGWKYHLTFIVDHRLHYLDVEFTETAAVVAQALANQYNTRVSIWDTDNNRTIIMPLQK